MPQYWAGFAGGKLHTRDVDNGWGGFGMGRMVRTPMLFTARAKALEEYEDVRKVEVRVVSRPKTKKRR